MKILFLSPRADVITALQRQGAEVTLLLEDDDFPAAESYATGLARLRVASLDSLGDVTAAGTELIASGNRPDRIISGTERGQFAAGVLAALLGISSSQLKLAVATRNKRMMKELAQRDGINTAAFAAIDSDATLDEIMAAIERTGLPAVLKPIAGGGTLDTFAVTSQQELVAALAQIKAKGPELNKLLLERHVEGREYHVDGIWREGEPLFFAVSRYFLPVIEWTERPWQGGSFYLEREMNRDLYERMLALHRRVNASLEIRDGITHFECFEEAGTGELSFSEVATRPAGSFVSQMYATRFGSSLAEMWSEYLVHGRVSLRDVNAGQLCAWVNVPGPRPGVLRRLPSADELRTIAEIKDYRYTNKIGGIVQRELPYWVMQLAVVVRDDAHLDALTVQLQHQLRIDVEAPAS